MDERLTNLEIRYTHQEHTLEELSSQIHELQNQVALLTNQLRQHQDWLKSLMPTQLAALSEETPPPHY